MLNFKTPLAPQAPAPVPPLPTPQPANDESVIAREMSIRGGVENGGRLHLSGVVFGNVKVERLTLADTASLEGHVDAQVVEIHGRLVGGIKARDVRLGATARVEGDIAYTTLAIAAGAKLNGRCLPNDAE